MYGILPPFEEMICDVLIRRGKCKYNGNTCKVLLETPNITVEAKLTTRGYVSIRVCKDGCIVHEWDKSLNTEENKENGC